MEYSTQVPSEILCQSCYAYFEFSSSPAFKSDLPSVRSGIDPSNGEDTLSGHAAISLVYEKDAYCS